MLRTCSSYTVQTGGPGGNVNPPACQGPGRQAQSRNSALAQMTQGISGSGARRWSVRKPCRAAQVQEISARCLLYRGAGGKRTAGPRRSRGPAGSVPRRSFGSFPIAGKGTRPAGRNPFRHPTAGTREGRPLIRHGMRRDTFPPEGEGFGENGTPPDRGTGLCRRACFTENCCL